MAMFAKKVDGDSKLGMEAAVLRLNAELFHFDLSGLTTIQYAVYRQSEAGYFDWHNDYGRYRGDPGQEPRKVTMSLQLSDGASYDGCDLEVRAAWPTDVAPVVQAIPAAATAPSAALVVAAAHSAPTSSAPP